MQTMGEATVTNSEGQQGLRYYPSWNDAYKWLVYDTVVDKELCGTCHTACKMNVFLPNRSRDKDSRLTFIKK